MADNEDSVIPDTAIEAATMAVYQWLMLYTLPANYTLDREYNSAVADANSESLARAALQAAVPHLLEVVTTGEELEALWIGSVVLSDGNAYQHCGRGDWSGGDANRKNSGISLPATVIHNANPYRNR